MFKLIRTAFLSFVLLTILTGVLYPLVVTAAAQVFFPSQANGSLIQVNGETVGSVLIGQANADERYFWPRPSAVNYNAALSGGSNLGATSAALAESVDQRAADFAAANGVDADTVIPNDMLFASGSGLDPHISPEAARLQIERVAAARSLDRAQVTALVEQYVEGPQWFVMGQPRVNVLLLNLALDAL
jgi:potassium-transporting ATPase KdpC subunit